ncbi:hypothetical protein Tco_0837747 [Tanacetum coccineum]
MRINERGFETIGVAGIGNESLYRAVSRGLMGDEDSSDPDSKPTILHDIVYSSPLLLFFLGVPSSASPTSTLIFAKACGSFIQAVPLLFPTTSSHWPFIASISVLPRSISSPSLSVPQSSSTTLSFPSLRCCVMQSQQSLHRIPWPAYPWCLLIFLIKVESTSCNLANLRS